MNKVFLIGDSTCQNNYDDTFPQKGWGQYFNEYINPKFKVINLAKNGRSSKSFYNEGLFDYVDKYISKGDYLFIEFGHNDEKDDDERHTDPSSTYLEYLSIYIDKALEVGAIPVLLSSIYRRKFISEFVLDDNCHGQYPHQMELLSKKKNVTFIDLTKITKEELSKIGFKASREYFMNFDSNIYPNYFEGKEDNTHLREKGARFICNLIIKEIKKIKELDDLI